MEKKKTDELWITENEVKTLYETPFIRLYDLQYEEGKHYYDASRRKKENLAAVKSDEQRKNLIPDAVSIILILKDQKGRDLLLTEYEYRYPIGREVMGLPAGLIDPDDLKKDHPLTAAAIREIHEETGIVIRDSDRIIELNPLVWNTPGFTDESTALIAVIAGMDDLEELSQDGAVGSERFDGFELLSREKAKQCIESGRDPGGNYYPMVTWCAMMYYLSDLWK